MANRFNLTDESALRKKVVEIHAHDGSLFDTGPLLASIEGILHLVAPGPDTNNEEGDKLRTSMPTPVFDTLSDSLPSLLHQITCVLNCKCLGGDSDASAMEILQLLATYTWEAKIVIIIASYVVEYGHCYSLVASSSDPLAKLVASLKLQRVADTAIKSKFDMIIRLVRVSIELTKFITEFSCFSSMYPSSDAEPMVAASNQIPIAVYWMTRVVVACASQHSQILGHSQITTSYTETLNITTLEQKITTIQTSFKTQLDVCQAYVEEKKQIKYVEKLKVMFHQTTVHVDNQKVLKAIINRKDGPPPLSCGQQVTNMVGVETLRGKTVLLLISDLEISREEITRITHFYNESRTKAEYQYEIVWLPIVEKIEKFEEKYTELKCVMPWHALEHPNLIKPGFVRYVKEEWKYSKKSIMVALDQRGRVVHQNASHMMWTWGNAVYPFTQTRELELWKKEEWSVKILVEQIHGSILTWIKEDKFVCLFGGEDEQWIQAFVTTASRVAEAAEIKLEMVYICKKNTRSQDITKFSEIVSKHGTAWESHKSTHFWTRIESIMYSKVHHGAKFASEMESGDHILGEAIGMLSLGENEKGWALMGHAAASGPGKIAKAKGDVMHDALEKFETWSVEVKQKGFAAALHDYLKGVPMAEHHCNRLILPGIEDIPGAMMCSECGRRMEKFSIEKSLQLLNIRLGLRSNEHIIHVQNKIDHRTVISGTHNNRKNSSYIPTGSCNCQTSYITALETA